MNEGPYTQLPTNLPVPVDDGACAHLPGKRLPDIALLATSKQRVNLRRPGVLLPAGWDAIPGARGCTPESCGFRDLHAEMRQLGAEVFGLSTQTSDYQREARDRLHLPFELLSDEGFAFIDALSLPIFAVDSMWLVRRLTLVCLSGIIEHVFYPIFPPDRHAAEVVAFLKSRKA
jgi:peroxiredoxin